MSWLTQPIGMSPLQIFLCCMVSAAVMDYLGQRGE